MINLKHLTQKCIINASVLSHLREQTQSNQATSNIQLEFIEKIDSLINDHLRGMDFQTRRKVRTQLIETHFRANRDFEITYYDVFQILTSLDLPINQMITNFQNWILMSTEYNLSTNETIQLFLEEKNNHVTNFQNESETFPELETSSSSEVVNIYPETIPEELPIEEVPTILDDSSTQPKHLKYSVLLIFILILSLAGFGVIKHLDAPKEIGFAEASFLIKEESFRPASLVLIVRVIYSEHSSGFPDFLQYEPINIERLNGYLKRKNSLLATEPYFSAIIHAAAVENVDPALMFAITGQEQGFVKRGSENAALIVNNPFNVYTSWIDYNTDINDASRIAAETIRSALEKRTPNQNAFQWLNKTYAEDSNWWIGVEEIFLDIETYLGPYQAPPRGSSLTKK